MDEKIVLPEDWSEVLLPKNFDYILEKYGLGYNVGVSTPSRVLATIANVSYNQFPILNPIKIAILADSNADSVNKIRQILPSSSNIEKYETELKGGHFIDEIGEIVFPPRLRYEAKQVGDAPQGLAGSFVTGAEILPSADRKIDEIVKEINDYFHVSKYGAGFRIGINSLGGTEVLNLGARLKESISPRIKIAIWIIDNKHPNLLPLLAYRLKCKVMEKELVILRVNNKMPLHEGDISLAQGLCGLLVQYGQRGKPDFTTTLRLFKDKYNNIITFDYANVEIPVFPMKIKKALFGIIPIGSKWVIRRTQDAPKIISKELEKLTRISNEGFYFILGSFVANELKDIEEACRLYIGENPVVAVPCASYITKRGSYHFMRATIIRFRDGNNILKEIFGCSDKDEIPEEKLDKIINNKKYHDINKGLKMASQYYGIDPYNFIRGEWK
jgi:hypothetical protein